MGTETPHPHPRLAKLHIRLLRERGNKKTGKKKSRGGHDRSLAREARDQRGHSGSGASRPGDSRRLPAPRVEPRPWLPRPPAELHTPAASPAAAGAAAAPRRQRNPGLPGGQAPSAVSAVTNRRPAGKLPKFGEF